MKKWYYIITVILLVFCISGCQNTQIQSEETVSEQVLPTEIETTDETFSAPATEQDIFEQSAQEYGLNSDDLKIVKTMYEELQDYMELQNSITEPYTRNPVDINQAFIVYYGDYPIFVGCYPIDSTLLYYSLKINDDGTLSDTDFDYNVYVNATKSDSGFIDTSTTTNPIVFGNKYGEENNKKWLCYAYSEYKQKRQEKFGDMQEISDEYSKKLNDTQTAMLTNILDYIDDWETYSSKPCIYIGIWSFGDGTSEILCTHGSVDFHTEKSTQYSGSNHGYSITEDGCTKLDESETERLERDLSSQNKLYWSKDWIDETKKEKLAEFIFNISQFFHNRKSTFSMPLC